MPEEWQDEVDPALWRALLTPLRRVGTLRVHVALASDLERALWLQTDGAGGQLIGQGLDLLLQDLHTLVLLHGSDKHALTAASDALSGFVEEWGHAGHPVKVESQDLSKLWKRTRLVSLTLLSPEALALTHAPSETRLPRRNSPLNQPRVVLRNSRMCVVPLHIISVNPAQ
jgi:hypothetical protein